MKKAFLLFLFCLSLHIYAQIPNGTWRDHLPLKIGEGLAKTENQIFCYMHSGGMLSYDLTTSELSKWTTTNGLCEIDITAIAFNVQTNTLIVGYESGNIDLIKSNLIKNISDITRKDIYNDKTINNIFIYEQYAYLSCDFGIVVIDTEKEEFKDSYVFGESGKAIKTNDLTIFENQIFAATDEGLFVAELDAPNLVDYNYWKLSDNQPHSTEAFYNEIETFGGKIIISYRDPNFSWDYLSTGNGLSWNAWSKAYNYRVNSIYSDEDYITVSGFGKLTVFNNNFELVAEINDRNISSAIVEELNIYTCGDNVGFAKRNFENSIDTLSVNAPMFSRVGKIFTKNDNVFVTTGGSIYPYAFGGIYNFRNDLWNTINKFTSSGWDSVYNTSHIAIHPLYENNILVGSWKYGILNIENNIITNHFTHTNTDVFTNLESAAGAIYIAGMGYGYENKCWFLLDEIEQPLFVYGENGTWERKNLQNSLVRNSRKYRALIVTSANQIWMVSNSDGIAVVKENVDGTFSEKTFTLVNQFGETYSRAYSIAEDNDGNIWIGTGNGPLEYLNVENIFNQDNITAYHVNIPRNDGTEYGDLLLRGEKINDIYIDGGNRKWFATENSGVFLISEDGKESIQNFTTDNSPIYSNDVLSVAVQENTGEVFFSTTKGLVSFMGQSTKAKKDYEDVYIYPNPVRPGYSGDIVISGLVEESIVKITDISGNLVWETNSFGGQAVWHGKNFDGIKVATGVYLVMLSNQDGTKTHISKLLFVN